MLRAVRACFETATVATNRKYKAGRGSYGAASQPVDALHSGELARGRVGDWRLNVDPAMRSFAVVMLGEVVEDRLGDAR
jgi:hypothetical protein